MFLVTFFVFLLDGNCFVTTDAGLLIPKTTGVVNFSDFSASSCEVIEENGFLKERCIIAGKWYFSCPFSGHSYYRLLTSRCNHLAQFSSMCPKDWSFYQVCGHHACEQDLTLGGNKAFGVCGRALCIPMNNQFSLYKDEAQTLDGLFKCNGKKNCRNLVNGLPVDEAECESAGRKTSSKKVACVPGTVQNGPLKSISQSEVCNDVCDCDSCSDEAMCNNKTIGVFCPKAFKSKVTIYVQPFLMCDGKAHCGYAKDETDCVVRGKTCEHYTSLVYGGSTRLILHS